MVKGFGGTGGTGLVNNDQGFGGRDGACVGQDAELDKASATGYDTTFAFPNASDTDTGCRAGATSRRLRTFRRPVAVGPRGG